VSARCICTFNSQKVCLIGISLQPVSTCATELCLLEDTGQNGQVHTCVTMAGAQQNVQALCLDGPIRVHVYCYGRCPCLQTGLGQGTAAARVFHHTPSTVLLSITGSLSTSASAESLWSVVQQDMLALSMWRNRQICCTACLQSQCFSSCRLMISHA